MSDISINKSQPVTTFIDYLVHPAFDDNMQFIEDMAIYNGFSIDVVQHLKDTQGSSDGDDWEGQKNILRDTISTLTGVAYMLEKLIDDAPETAASFDEKKAHDTQAALNSERVGYEWVKTDTDEPLPSSKQPYDNDDIPDDLVKLILAFQGKVSDLGLAQPFDNDNIPADVEKLFMAFRAEISDLKLACTIEQAELLADLKMTAA
jgi:hypothetical protein